MSEARLYVENTYQLEPEIPLTTLIIRPHVQKALEKQFSTWSYSSSDGASKSRDTCAMIQNFILGAGEIPPRYKIVIQVFIAPLKGQGMRLASRSVWDPKTDNLVSETFMGKDYAATALVFYTYNE
ncbi:Tctex-1 family protein [Giardia muris]|uniref:Tctex-1 family protein n=1 Tax=Giardia muris TaxID=5742 RepID=A0A4Z1TD94_GIAMU|nr:Tctex-1 family protein [Giardia muris]|eukprot:TNJ30501.1 Tctex-1 family protein [Giardia muris]